MVHPDFFDDVRMPVLRATDRLRALAPIIEKALRHHYGPKWRKVLAQQARQAGRSPSGLYDPRYLLRLIVHEPALANVFDDSARDKARRLSAMANHVAHCDHRRLWPGEPPALSYSLTCKMRVLASRCKNCDSAI